MNTLTHTKGASCDSDQGMDAVYERQAAERYHEMMGHNLPREERLARLRRAAAKARSSQA